MAPGWWWKSPSATCWPTTAPPWRRSTACTTPVSAWPWTTSARATTNLDTIRNFPFDYLKIDRQFTQDVSPDGRALLRSIVAMAHALPAGGHRGGYASSEAQHALLAELGVDCAQGYLYRRPASAR